MRIHQLPGSATGRLRPLAAAICMMPLLAAAADGPRVVLGGDVGRAAASCAHRFLGDPFNSLPWLRADLTGERVTEFDDLWDHPMNRPFKNYSGDISGRFIEIMALDSRGDRAVHPALKGLLRAVSDEQRPGGYFCASGVIDWQQPIDFRPEGGMDGWGRMMPALWGNARLLRGLVEAARAFPADTAIAGAARRLGDFYISVLPRFNNPDRMAEYAAAGSYAAGYVTCWFPAMEGLVKLRNLTGDRKYLFLQNQTAKGGFGHRSMLCDDEGVYGFGEEVEESTWCCTYHGELGFINLRRHLLARGDGTLTCNFALDLTAKDGAGATSSVLRPGLKAGEVLRQRISLAGQPAAVIRIRKPLWADTVTAVDTAGASLPLAAEDGWCATTRPVSDVEFVYSGGVYAEDRHGARLTDGPRAGEPFVLGYGPKLLAAEGRTAAAPRWPTTLADLEAKGLRPFPGELRGKDCCFVFGRGE